MISPKEDYRKYLEADRKSLGKTKSIKSFLFDNIWRFQRTLRRLEYLIDSKRNPLIVMFAKLYSRRHSIKLGFDIPYTIFGADLSIAHYRQIIVNGGAKVGKNCRIHKGVTIGAVAGTGADTTEIGDNAFIGPSAVHSGKIIIADNIAIGANSVVIKSFPIRNITTGGILNKIISQKGTDNILTKGAKCL